MLKGEAYGEDCPISVGPPSASHNSPVASSEEAEEAAGSAHLIRAHEYVGVGVRAEPECDWSFREGLVRADDAPGAARLLE